MAGAPRPGGAEDPSGPTDEDTRIADAAASALARARQGAVGKGLRPGMRPPRRRRVAGSAPMSGSGLDGRDPALLGEQLDRLLVDRGWKLDVAVGAVMGRWAQIVGPDIATHVVPVTFTDGVLTVQADSTAWATQMRLLASSVLGRVEEEIGAGAVSDLQVLGPSAPSWRRGPRRSPDSRGPRDTYG
ncbi:MAG: DciA family protein [Micrococcales bacterium]|nr:DciA family protein [Micrococcales bacterium]